MFDRREEDVTNILYYFQQYILLHIFCSTFNLTNFIFLCRKGPNDTLCYRMYTRLKSMKSVYCACASFSLHLIPCEKKQI